MRDGEVELTVITGSGLPFARRKQVGPDARTDVDQLAEAKAVGRPCEQRNAREERERDERGSCGRAGRGALHPYGRPSGALSGPIFITWRRRSSRTCRSRSTRRERG